MVAMKAKNSSVLLLVLMLAAAFLGASAYADSAGNAGNSSGAAPVSVAVSDAAKTIKSFSAGKLTRDNLKSTLEEKYAQGTISKADLKSALIDAYRKNVLKRDDVKFILTAMYKEKKLKLADFKWLLYQAYAKKELSREDVSDIISSAYKSGALSLGDLKFLLIDAYDAGELKKDDVKWILVHAYNKGQLTRSDLKWLTVNSYKEGKLAREDLSEIITAVYLRGGLKRDDMRWIIVNSYKDGTLKLDDVRYIVMSAYRRGELKRSDVKWLILNSYKEGILTKDDVKAIFKAAYAQGDLRKSDIEIILNEGYKAGDISKADVSAADVAEGPIDAAAGPVPSMPDMSAKDIENAAETAADSMDSKDAKDAKDVKDAKDGLKTTQANMLYKYALIPAEKHRIGMDAIIGYVESINGTAAKLVTLKDAFAAQEESLNAAAEKADYKGARAIVDQMKKIVSEFRAEANAQLAVSTKTAAAKDALNKALEANEDYLDSLVTDSREAKKDRNLEAFDFANAKIQARLDKAKASGANVSALQAKLDEIKDKRSALLDAMNAGVESCKGEGLGKCATPESQAYIALKKDLESDYNGLRELAKNIGREQKIGNAIAEAEKIAGRAKEALLKAEKNGRDTDAHKAKLSEIEAKIGGAKAKYAAKDYSGAISELKSAKSAFEALKKSAAAKVQAPAAKNKEKQLQK